ncbi:MAG: hypothetical protein Ta2G_12380 [Termitinemataceae bacterium]|nr:MAG: hypothetical protein Ta2G_12380 [Termitinemataceae bacterium]
MTEAPNMILIGSSARNSGKTFLACALIRRLKALNEEPVIALKITCAEGSGKACPRGGAGCGACSIDGDYCLSEEKRAPSSVKDTQQLLASGADKVFWLRCLREKLESAYASFLEELQSKSGCKTTIICESNTLRTIVRPAVFVMIMDDDNGIKKSAQAVAQKADVTLHTNFNEKDTAAVLKRFLSTGKICV